VRQAESGSEVLGEGQPALSPGEGAVCPSPKAPHQGRSQDLEIGGTMASPLFPSSFPLPSLPLEVRPLKSS